MSNVPGVIPSAAAGVPLIPTKRTRLEYSTVAKTGYIDPAQPDIELLEKVLKTKTRFDLHKNSRQKQLKIAKKQPILTEKLTVITFNVRGIKECQHEFNELMHARHLTVAAVQETLLNKKSYRYKLPGYTVIESKSYQNLGGNELLIALKNNSDF
ncbi:hypothetical protein BB561_004679 [Smittium simulii]|uniref:Endonuclease/exonuclease/phosphatase domain-containing protein n=1 Tax=Smittium simulii TaxID=133385 RepID=A0A2T9YEU9_9FUNG|nr:hypothetical protein BB561_004679 [Smittium simulii]